MFAHWHNPLQTASLLAARYSLAVGQLAGHGEALTLDLLQGLPLLPLFKDASIKGEIVTSSEENTKDLCAVSIRAMRETDVPELLRLMEAIVKFERGTNFQLTETELLRRGFGERPEFGAYVADAGNNRLAGMAVHYEVPFMHSLKPLFMLKWLYVDPGQRGGKIGKRLMQAICQCATSLGHSQVNWFVLYDNRRAQQFYESLGATPDPEWARWILPSEALKTLAEREIEASV